ncbi:MAG: glycosyltransferase family 2 protein [Patescibacteria group bacterium]
MNNIKLSIVILNHNTKDIILNCLDSLEKVRNELPFEVIVSDNASNDGSVRAIKNKYSWVKVIEGPNISYSNGNNRARNIVQGKYVLLLNSDTLVHKNTLKKCVEYLENHKDVGALTCKLVLPNGKLDKDARRRFPTPWISFKRLFLGNGREYWYGGISPDRTHEVDAIQGAFFLTKKEILDKVNWLDEKFIFDGEDLDLSFQIKKIGYKIIYFPDVSITHIKKASKSNFSGIERKMQGVDIMEYFYRKNLWNNYPILFNYFVLLGIRFLKLFRFIQAKLKI